MVTGQQFEKAAKLAIQNVINHGDTDIFPFPIENHCFYDKPQETLDLIKTYNDNFEGYLSRYPPTNIHSLTPVSYTGFRWATQLDPIWNLLFLSCVISVAGDIEKSRLPASENIVYSYRYQPDNKGSLFSNEYGWKSFMEMSTDIAQEYKYVVVCDISEFYARLGHHRLEVAMQQVCKDNNYCQKVMKFLGNFSGTRSFSLPIGGPAARILSELTINQVDHLLRMRNIKFTRFADDYHLFANSHAEAFNNLVYLSEKLFENQGLSLQKSKTRILSSAEFISNSPLSNQKDGKETNQASRLLNFSLRFDPYSPTAADDYEALKEEIKKFDILGLLKSELSKTRIHTALAKKIIMAIQHLSPTPKNEAILSIIYNSETLYPIYASVLLTIDRVFDDLSQDTQSRVIRKLIELVGSDTHIMRIDIVLAYAIKVLSRSTDMEIRILFEQVYQQRTSPLIRREIILALARLHEWHWLSDRRNHFRELSSPERRAFIIASYFLKDEGRHWRDHTKEEFDPFENFVRGWASEKTSKNGWSIPH